MLSYFTGLIMSRPCDRCVLAHPPDREVAEILSIKSSVCKCIETGEERETILCLTSMVHAGLELIMQPRKTLNF